MLDRYINKWMVTDTLNTGKKYILCIATSLSNMVLKFLNFNLLQ